METTTRLLLPDVTEVLKANPQDIIELAEELHPADLADLAVTLEPELAHVLLRVLPIPVTARLLEACDGQQRVALFESLAQEDSGAAVAITVEMAADDRADLFALLSPDLRARLLDLIKPEESRDIRELLAYPEGSAGALMTTDFVALPANTTTAEAIDLVRHSAEAMETIYTAYAVDANGRLLGAVSLRDLVTSPASRTIDAIMNPNVLSVSANADQEDAARLLAKYDLLAVPVVDDEQHILGIITVDDLLDVIQEEATEDAQRMGAVEPLETPYVTTPFMHVIRARAPWLMALFTAGLATTTVLEHYSASALQSVTMLMWFVPLIVSSGGNSGSQSATLIIRALALGRLQSSDARRVLMREVGVGVTLGLMVAFIGVIRILATSSTRSLEMAVTVALAITGVVTLGSIIGGGVPLLLNRLRLDPAVSSTPFIASILDITGLLVYFEIAKLFFQ